VTRPKSPASLSARSTGLRQQAGDSARNLAHAAQAVTLLLDLSSDKSAALKWANEQMPGASIRLIDKAQLKWGSKREARTRIRAMKPHTFAVFTSDLEAQSARGGILIFGAVCGARRIIFGDGNGRVITRTRATAFVVEGARLAFEIATGYLVIVPLSWLLTAALGAALVFRKVTRASRSRKPGPFEIDGETFTALYVRATIAPASPGGAVAAGGMASHVAGFARGALALGHKLKFISSGGVGAGHGVEVKVIKPSTTLSATRALFELFNNLKFTARALSHVMTGACDEIDFIYQRYSRFNWTGVLLSLVTGLPLVLEFNGSEVWVSQHWDPVGHIALLRRFERLNQRAADLIFVVSDVQRRGLIDDGVDAGRVVINPNGVDTDEFHPGCGGGGVRRALGIEEKTVVGFVGTFGPWHGAPVLAEAAARINDSARFHFLFIGDGEQRAAAERIIESSPNKVGATFAGRVSHDNVAAHLDACDILVAPHVPASDGSEFFGSPTKLFEYMAMARPVIASRLGQIAEVIDDGENGLLVEPGDADGLRRAIERLARDEATRARLAAAARRTVIDRYTWQRNAARVFDRFKVWAGLRAPSRYDSD
jgi:glycosyltransferase involved in cell wall biosynthesis